MADAVLDFGQGHHVVVEGFAVDPVGHKWQRPHRPLPAAGVAESEQGPVVGDGDEDHAPGAVVGRQGDAGEGPEGLEQGAEGRGDGPLG